MVCLTVQNPVSILSKPPTVGSSRSSIRWVISGLRSNHGASDQVPLRALLNGQAAIYLLAGLLALVLVVPHRLTDAPTQHTDPEQNTAISCNE